MHDSRLIWREPVLTHAISACIGGFGELGELGEQGRKVEVISRRKKCLKC